MKKVLFSLLTLAVLFFSSCRGDEGPMGPMGPAGPAGANGQNGLDGYNGRDGRDGQDGEGLQYRKFDFTVESQDWKFVKGQDSDYFKYTFKFDYKHDLDLAEMASVNVYRYLDGNYQRPLPAVTPLYELDDDGQKICYFENVDYEYAPGEISFFVTYSDFFYQDNVNPEDMAFRVIIFWPN